tara:strand:+ start:48 stop:287 length:240 start_codon:yes stop_codon:yes gene_type:complete
MNKLQLYSSSHSDKSIDAIEAEAEYWTAEQALEIILSEWADDEELIDIAKFMQTRRIECGQYDADGNIVHPTQAEIINY